MGPELKLATFLRRRWLPTIEHAVRPTTLVGYRGHVLNHIGPRIGDVLLPAVKPATLNSLYAALLADGFSAGTVRRVHATLSRAMGDAVRWGLIETNPARGCDPPRLAHVEMSAWSAEEVRCFLHAVSNDELYAMWVLFATTGMRRGEVLGLRWEDVDLDAGVIAVRQTLVSVSGQVQFSTPKTARGRRVVALDPSTVEALADHRAGHNNGLVFTMRGRPLQPESVSKRFVTLARRAGLRPIRLHDLRHTHATLALRAGVHPKIVSERLGHSAVAFTLDVYSHVIPHMQKEAAERIAAMVFGP